MTRHGRLAAILVAIAAAVAFTPAAASAQAVPCSFVATYPGDGAPQAPIAAWMAYGVSLAGLPRELPVMGALVESGVRNLRTGDADSVGYFQMRLSIWNGGEYAGYLDNPPLQLKWFADYAAKARAARVAAGLADPAFDENLWGDWIADVLRPPENLRGRYQQRLAEARVLSGPPCTPDAGAPAPGAIVALAPPAAPDTTAPALALSSRRSQRALHADGIVVAVRCPAEACAASATASIVMPRARRALKLVLPARAIAAGATSRLRFVPRGIARRRIRAALRERSSLKVTVRVVAADAAGNRTAAKRTVRVTR
jgi:hypothetical protein